MTSCPRSFELVLCAIALTAAACPEERIDPVTAPTEDPGTGGGPPAEARVRDVFLRNPVGTPALNLLADGDFELSIVPGGSGQHGWTAFSSNGGEARLDAETGGLCKTGIRCGKVARGTILFGRGTSAAAGATHVATMWMKPTEPLPEGTERPCDLGDVYVIECDALTTVTRLRPADAPDENGWCSHSTTVRASNTALCMYMEVGSVGLLLDNATLLPAPPTAPKPAAPADSVAPDTRERVRMIGGLVRARTRYGAPEPVSDGEPTRPD
jgi:hypothetical protein